MVATGRREQLRAILNGTRCVYPASVFDAVSARIAESLGYEVAMLAGSVASATVLAAPDMAVLSATELSGLCRRIARSTNIGLIVDADHGYGNALNVMRTVEELEAAGVAGLTLEDTVLPETYGSDCASLTDITEMLDKLRAAVAARTDPALVVIGRTGALRHGGLADAVERVKSYESAGVDAIFLAGARSRDEIVEVRRAARLPLILGITPPGLVERPWLEANGICIAFRGHAPYQAAVSAFHHALSQLVEGVSPDDIPGVSDGKRILNDALRTEQYDRYRRDFLGKA